MLIPRERVLLTLERVLPDRVPLDIWTSYPFLQKLLEYFGCPKRVAVHPHLDREGIVDKVYDKLGVDLRMVMVEPPEHFKRVGVFDPRFHFPWGIRLREDVLKDEWGVIRTLNVTKTQSRIIGYPLKGKDVSYLDEYEFPDPYAPGRYDLVEKQIREWGEKYAVIGYPGGDPFFSQAWYLCGFNELIKHMYTNPPFVERLFEKLLYFFSATCKELVKLGVDMVMLADDVAWQESLLLPPSLWRRYVKPRLEKLISAIKGGREKAYVIYHSDGNISPIVPELIEIGVDILNPVQPEAMNPAEIKEKYGEKLILYGTISIQRTLPYGTVEDVRKEVMERIKTCGYNGGLILAPSNQVLIDTKIENFLALYECAKIYGRYPLRWVLMRNIY